MRRLPTPQSPLPEGPSQRPVTVSNPQWLMLLRPASAGQPGTVPRGLPDPPRARANAESPSGHVACQCSGSALLAKQRTTTSRPSRRGVDDCVRICVVTECSRLGAAPRAAALRDRVESMLSLTAGRMVLTRFNLAIDCVFRAPRAQKEIPRDLRGRQRAVPRIRGFPRGSSTVLERHRFTRCATCPVHLYVTYYHQAT